MVNGTISVYTYDDNWNYIHMMCVDKQNVCLSVFKTFSSLSKNNVCLPYIKLC